MDRIANCPTYVWIVYPANKEIGAACESQLPLRTGTRFIQPGIIAIWGQNTVCHVGCPMPCRPLSSVSCLNLQMLVACFLSSGDTPKCLPSLPGKPQEKVSQPSPQAGPGRCSCASCSALLSALACFKWDLASHCRLAAKGSGRLVPVS